MNTAGPTVYQSICFVLNAITLLLFFFFKEAIYSPLFKDLYPHLKENGPEAGSYRQGREVEKYGEMDKHKVGFGHYIGFLNNKKNLTTYPSLLSTNDR